MKNLRIFLISILFCATVNADFWSDFDKKFENMGKKHAEEEAKSIARGVHIRINNNKLNFDENNILRTAALIENGNPPDNVQSKSTSLTTTVRGKQVTVSMTMFSTGNSDEGAIHAVKTIYEDGQKKQPSINTFSWDANGTKTIQKNGGSMNVISNGGSSISIA
ncbi:uncharacterized protein LOC122502855 [Leptopilina heterotoma]|uniref:uncharacterized protein LOC122502855 n=1 Tax=Leptopilina heterotoma TaxID=63436 RepID=UPI001CAA10FE|nr:uncharacterized protein LOC122502855 [Leptopilina heterotoma]